jgi:anti-sigma B factor antagonist
VPRPGAAEDVLALAHPSEEPMDAGFAVARRNAVNGVVTLTVAGQLDDVSGDILNTMTLDAVTSDVNELVVDLARVSWMDEAGVDALLRGHDAALRAGCTYRITNPSGLVEYVLETNTRARQLLIKSRG